MRLIFGLLAALSVLSGVAAHAGTVEMTAKQVFAHYMVGQPMYAARPDIEDLARDIADARAAGVDGFQLNMNRWREKPRFRNIVKLMFAAAAREDAGFQLFFSFDSNPNSHGFFPPDEMIEAIKSYAMHPNYLRVGTRPVLTTWLGQGKDQDFWVANIIEPLRRDGVDVFFVPWFPPVGNNPDQAVRAVQRRYSGILNGLWWWAAGRSPLPASTGAAMGSIPDVGEAYARITHEEGLLYMASVVPAFWQTCKKNSAYVEYYGGRGLESQWRSIIGEQHPQWVNLVTWNDLGEDTHFSPYDNPRGFTSFGIAPVWSHAGLTALNTYFIRWWKGGIQPRPEADEIFFFYKNQAMDAKPTQKTCPDSRRVINGDVGDNLLVTALLTRPARLQVTSGGKEQSFALDVGLSHVAVAAGLGTPQFLIEREGKVVLSASGGKPVVATPEYRSWSIYTGHATTGR
jgi:glucan endo-1,3-alpha-glucosidase